MDPIQIAGVFNDDDRRAVRRTYASMNVGRNWGWFVLTLALMSFSLLVDQVSPAFLRWLPGACGLGLFWFSYIAPRQRQHRWVDARVTFSDTHIEAEADGALVRYPWARVAGHRVTRGVALIRVDTGAMIPVVKRWADDGQWTKARELLRQRCRPI